MGTETEATPATPTNPNNESAALAAAVEKSIAAELQAEQLKSETAKADRLEAENAEANGEAPATEGEERAAEAPPVEDDLPALAKILKTREKAREEQVRGKQEAEKVRDQILAEARAEQQRLIEDGRRQVEDYKREQLNKLKTRPLEAIGEIGWDRAQLVEEVAQAGTPQYQMMKRYEARAEAAEKKLSELSGKFDDATKRNEEAQRAYTAQVRAQVEREFLSLTSEALAPNLRALHDDADILRLAHATADRLRAEAGHEATKEEIRDFLEHQAKARIAKIRGTSGTQQAAANTAKGTEKKPASPAPRTLSAASLSERRATPRTPPSFANAREEYESLKEIAEAAMKEESAPKT